MQISGPQEPIPATDAKEEKALGEGLVLPSLVSPAEALRNCFYSKRVRSASEQMGLALRGMPPSPDVPRIFDFASTSRILDIVAKSKI